MSSEGLGANGEASGVEADGHLWAALGTGDQLHQEFLLSLECKETEFLEFDLDALPDFHVLGTGEPNPETETETEPQQAEDFAASTIDEFDGIEESDITGTSHASEEEVTLNPCHVTLERTAISPKNHTKPKRVRTKPNKKIKCQICHKEMCENRNLRRHILTHTQEEIDAMKIDEKPKGNGKFQCDICDKRLSRKDSLMRHLKMHARQDPFKEQVLKKTPEGKIVKMFFECDVCGWPSTRKESLARHLKNHDKQDPVYCAICNKPFRIAWELMDHMKLHDEDEVKFKPSSGDGKDGSVLKSGSTRSKYCKDESECNTADEEGEKDMNDDKLLDKDETVLETKEEAFFVGDCEKQFESLSSFEKHECKICNQRFKHQCLLDTHARVHTGEKPFSCKICKKSFRAKGELENHKVIHSDRKPTCNICKKQFTSRQTLRRHELLHTGEKPKKPYSCKMCQKKYASPGELVTHTRSHTGERIFTCDVCNKQFLRKQNLTKHLQAHTGEKLSCHLCEKQLSSSGSLRKHMRTHTDEKPYSCGVCNKQFRQSCTLKSHKRVHTGEKPFACAFCRKHFKQSSHLYRHRRLVHAGEAAYTPSERRPTNGFVGVGWVGVDGLAKANER